MRREILAQGWANVAVAATGGFPASASFTRSALLRLFGAQTRLAAVSSGLFTLPVVFFGSGLLAHIPLAALAGVVMAAAWSMLDRAALRRLWYGSKETRLLLGLTFVSTLVLPLERAVLLGIGAGLVLHIANTSAPRLTLLAPAPGRLRRLLPGEQPEAVVIEVSGNLHYAAVPPFVEEVERLLPESARTVVLDLSHAHEIRFSAMRALERLDEELRRDGARLVLAGVEDDVVELFRRAESTLMFVQLEPEPGLSVERALERTQPPRRYDSASGGSP
jgi:SulP family sulfate permease